MTRDFDNFLAQGGDVNNPASVQAWINGAADPRISRDVTGVMTRVITNRLNAQSMKHKAYDVYARYNLDLETYGSFRFNLDATYVDEYSFDLGFGIPPGEAAGSQNESIANIPPIPEWRVTGTANWSRGNHSAMIRTRWTDGFDLAFNSSGLQSAQIAINGTDKMDDITYLDVNYRYTFDGLIGDGTTTLEVGGRNILDEFPDPIFNLGGIETFVHDIRGATYYFRINQQF